MAPATTLCSTGAAMAAARGSIDTSGAGGCRWLLAPRWTRRDGSSTRERRPGMTDLRSRTQRDRAAGPARRRTRERRQGDWRQRVLGGWLLLTAASPPGPRPRPDQPSLPWMPQLWALYEEGPDGKGGLVGLWRGQLGVGLLLHSLFASR